MDKLIEFILQFGTLQPDQIALVIRAGSEIVVKKDEYFSEAGKIPRQVGFVTEGVIRGCYYSNKGEEITRCFIDENNLVVDYPNFETASASSEYLQACTDSKLIVFSKKDWEGLSDSVVGWDDIRNKMVRKCMFLKSRKSPVVSQDGTTRYLEFMNNYPLLINRIPLAFVASYIGVTPQSLSRIRKNIQ